MSFFLMCLFLILSCVGSSLLYLGFPYLQRAWAFHLLLQRTGSRVHRFQELWHLDLAALWHVESSPTKDRPCVPCVGRRIPDHWSTREAQCLSSDEESRKCGYLSLKKTLKGRNHGNGAEWYPRESIHWVQLVWWEQNPAHVVCGL